MVRVIHLGREAKTYAPLRVRRDAGKLVLLVKSLKQFILFISLLLRHFAELFTGGYNLGIRSLHPHELAELGCRLAIVFANKGRLPLRLDLFLLMERKPLNAG